MYGTVRDHFTMYKVNGAPNSVANLPNTLDSALKVVPNPFQKTTTVQFELKQADNIKVKLTDVAGKVTEVFSGNLKEGKNSIEIDAVQLQLASGVYILQLSGAKESATTTVIRLN
jgi:hypothetical protein